MKPAQSDTIRVLCKRCRIAREISLATAAAARPRCPQCMGKMSHVR